MTAAWVRCRMPFHRARERVPGPPMPGMAMHSSWRCATVQHDGDALRRLPVVELTLAGHPPCGRCWGRAAPRAPCKVGSPAWYFRLNRGKAREEIDARPLQAVYRAGGGL